ncbi:peptide ABC transporter substrate-binding protein [Labrys monachus]|uniref:Peptide/nickel transport system substrate-binding protein n=1 Tax=Labrys monachus TaxID=217067 RepID=A0ABU0FAG9_9HYPH|nr:peptide ABC transporter substrate-binding protein [Labrys monachus]MDQ0391322.1 peptide/nickel transport system substrate-binding protein [Labrys monachus]
MTEHSKDKTGLRGASILKPSRRQLLALGASAGFLTWLGPQRGWIDAAHAATPPAKPTGQAIVGLSQEPTVFHPLLVHIEVDEAVYFNLFSALWRVDPKGAFQPDLVAEIPTVENGGISADGLNWRIKLKDNVKWHDGTPFTADDVKFNIELIQNPKFIAGRRAGHELVRDIKIVSPTELTWRMEKAYAPYPAILSWTFLVPKHILEKEADLNKPAFTTSPVGTGPFKWVERVPGDHITLAAHDGYHGDGPYLERLIVKYIPDMTVLYTQFQTGDIDYIGLQGITPDHYEEAKGLADRAVMPVPQPFIENIAVNVGLPVFKDKAVREALYYGMDKKSVIEQIYYGLPSETESFLPKQSWAFNPDLPKHEFDPEKAKKILDEAGWALGSDGVRAKDGVRLEFVNSTTAGNHVREQAQQLLQQNWADIGAKMTINNLPPAVMWGDFWMQSKFESAMVGIGFMIGPDPDATDFFSSRSIGAKGGSGQNTTQFENPEVDGLLAEGAKTVDLEKRKAAYRKMQEVTRAELPYLPIFQYAMVSGVKAKLEGFTPNVNVQENCWNANTWYWAT